MLIFTNRELDGRTDKSAFERNLAAGSARRALATLAGAPQGTAARWKVSQTDSDIDDAESMQALLPMFQGSGPLLVYLHGYNSTPAACFDRCDRLQSLYGLEIVRFSWSSKKYLLDDSNLHGLVAGLDSGIRRDFARLLGSQHYVQSNECPKPPVRVACDLESLTCSWWLLMALTGSTPH